MRRLWSSVAFRLALAYGLSTIASIFVLSAVIHRAMLEVLDTGTDTRLVLLSNGLFDHFSTVGTDGLRQQIAMLLADEIDQDTEEYLLIGPDGQTLAGNIAGWTPSTAQLGQLELRKVIRDGVPTVSRLLARRLSDGGMLVVGHDIADRLKIERLMRRALVVGGICAVLLATLAALLFRQRLEARIARIRYTAREIEAGDLSRRIPIPGTEDEFARLCRDINHMLDWIVRLMDGVRDVSNAIAHDLRTPLGRIRSQLDEAIQPGNRRGQLAESARAAIIQIDELTLVFDRLLQIAEAEAGTRRQSFVSVRLKTVIDNVVELYDAEAEARGITFLTEIDRRAAALGDKNLLASAVANLIDNALKYAGNGATVRVYSLRERDTQSIIIEDNGPGIPPAERSRVIERFYRMDRSRSMPGNGLGLSVVNAIASLHRGSLQLEDAIPGLRARIILPCAEQAAPSRSGMLEPVRIPEGG